MDDDGDFITPSELAALGDNMLCRAPRLSNVVRMRRFRSLFGVSPSVCSLLWSLLAGSRPRGTQPKQLLWALMLLNVYSTEAVHATIAGADEKTLRKWTRQLVRLLSELPLVCAVIFMF